MRTRALLYHDVVEPGCEDASGFAGPGPARYKLERPLFERHLDALAAGLGEPPALPGELAADVPGSRWALTFDDGGASALAVGRLLARRGWAGVFFVPTDYVGTPPFLDADGIRELASLGHVVGSHSCSHPPRMSQCPWDELVGEWSRSAEALGELVREPATTASVPAGYYSAEVARAAAAAGIELLFTSEPVTRPRREAGCLVVGRFSLRHGSPARLAVALARGRPAPRLRQYAAWNARKSVKAVAGDRYATARRALLARR